MKCNFGIAGIAYAVGEHSVDARQFASAMAEQGLDFPPYGAETLQRTSRGSLDLAVEACAALFAEGDFDPARIDCILYCHSRIPDIFGVNNGTDLAARLGLPSRRVIEVSYSCVGVMGMLEQAQMLFSAYPGFENILLVTSDRAPNDFNFINIYSHGAAAALLQRTAPLQVLYNDVRNDGRFARLIPAVGGSSAPDHVDLFKNAYPDDLPSLVQEFNVATKTIGVSQYQDALDALNLAPERIGKTITLNISRTLLIKAMEKQGVAEDNLFLDNVPRLHHIGGADILINLKDYLETKPRAEYIRLYALGLGHFWGTSILQATTV
ncbi:MAG TPA: hypothetical protein PLW86_06195 [Rhodocyclaceae bacterium]|nr:hypothetical protein [Rhodocyclaceae bacterium]